MSEVRTFTAHEGLRLRQLRTAEPTPRTCALCPRKPALVWAVPRLGLAMVTCRPCAPDFMRQILADELLGGQI